MAKVTTGSQSFLLLPQLQPHAALTGRRLSFVRYGGVTSSYNFFPSLRVTSWQSLVPLTPAICQTSPGVLKEHYAIPISRASSLDVEVPGEVADMKPDTTGGAGDEGSGNNGNDGGGGGGGDGNDNGGDKGDEGSDEADAKKNKALSMSQKITVAYAALVGMGGFMGYLKSGSQKSLAAGGLSALLLYYVYTELPKRPVFASAVGLGLSAALLVVMGFRFKRSGKVFPAGIVSLASFIMTGGYVHGIVKTH